MSAGAVVTFRLADQWIGLPVDVIQEVLVGVEHVSIPLAPAGVDGLMNLRGQIVTVVNPAVLLGLGDGGGGEVQVVVRHGGELFSLRVDGTGQVMEPEPDALRDPPATLEAEWKRCASAVVRSGDGLLVVLDLERLLAAIDACEAA